MKIYKKGAVILMVLFVILNMPSILFATTHNGQLDAVLVIDASGSMKETDPNKLGLEGVKLFVDMMAASGNQVGIVTYGSKVEATYPMKAVNSQSDKEAIKDFVDGLNRDLEYTDITAGLGKAIEMENQRDTSLGNKPLIILFTDGNNAVGGVAGRDNQKIDADLAVMLEQAKTAGYPIYTIGLNDNGKLNEAYLKNISEETGALAFATKDPNELPDILTQIFAAHSNL
ncbi:MAG: vWA domain-containing protein, partial [Cellulosilyticum sp.]|nr:vWA domain-containing protein [Cellulosilyticum sp.]